MGTARSATDPAEVPPTGITAANKRRDKMKKILVMTMLFVVTAGVAAWAADNPLQLADQVVVDRTTRDKSVNDYIMLTRNEIQRAWTTPVEVTGPDAVKGRIRINYVISRSGALRNLELVSGSGNAELDRSLMEAIRNAAPFPPFPEELRARSMLVRAHFIVADTPTVRVTQVQQDVKKSILPEASSSDNESPEKKLSWGLPAGTAQPSAATPDHDIPAPPPTKSFKWGL